MLRSIVAALALSLAASCGGDDGPPAFVLQINSMGVVPTAVSRIELVIDPVDLDRNFQMVPDGTHAGGEIFTRVSGGGEYVINIEQGYIDRNHVRPPSGPVFTLDVPLQGPSQDDSSIRDPVVRATFIRGTERIALGERFVPWPLPPGGEAVLSVTCLSEFGRQCSNNDGVDAGLPPPADGG